MKVFIIALLLLLSAQLFAQRINGIVYDKSTLLPILNATVTTAAFSTITSITGKFILNYAIQGEVLMISSIGYKTYSSTISAGHIDTLRVYLEPLITQLKDVMIKGTRNYQLDSIRNRKEFASTFAYRAPAVKDIFVGKSAGAYVPNNYVNAPNSTTSIVSINVLSLVGLLNKNNGPATRLQKTMVTDEQESYVDHIFSKSRISTITTLKGDSLIDFMDQYRPSAKKLKSMSDYDLALYIKTSYTEFIKTYKHQSGPFKVQ